MPRSLGTVLPVVAFPAAPGVTLLILQTPPQAPTASAPSGSSLSLQMLPCVIRLRAGHPRGGAPPPSPGHGPLATGLEPGWMGVWSSRSRLAVVRGTAREPGNCRNPAGSCARPSSRLTPKGACGGERPTPRPDALVPQCGAGRLRALPGLSRSCGRREGKAPCTGCTCGRRGGGVAGTGGACPQTRPAALWPLGPRARPGRLPLAAAQRPRAPSWLRAEPL